MKNTVNTKIGKLITDIRKSLVENGRELSDEEVRETIENRVLNEKWLLNENFEVIEKISDSVFYSIRRDLSILQPYMEDDTVSEIMVNGLSNVFIEQNGIIRETDCKFFSIGELEEVIRRIAAKVHREINEMCPIVDARLEDGSRVNGVYRNIALNGPILTIRKFPQNRITMKTLIDNQTISEEAAEFLEKIVSSGYNIFISGGTSSGKTTFLNALADFIPKKERIIVIEDSAELQIEGISNIVRLECKNSNSQGGGEISMADLIKTSLRMRPDRIIIGEVRDGTAFLQMLQAMNTGHDGSLSTGHGNSVEGMLRRLESLYLQETNFPLEAIQAQIGQGIDLMVHLGRLRDGSRKVLEICELLGSKNGDFIINPIFTYNISEGLSAVGDGLKKKEKLLIMERVHGTGENNHKKKRSKKK